MKNKFTYKGVNFEIGGYTPRNNEFERGLKYQLFVTDISTGANIPTGAKFETKHGAQNYAIENIYMWL